MNKGEIRKHPHRIYLESKITDYDNLTFFFSFRINRTKNRVTEKEERKRTYDKNTKEIGNRRRKNTKITRLKEETLS